MWRDEAEWLGASRLMGGTEAVIRTPSDWMGVCGIVCIGGSASILATHELRQSGPAEAVSATFARLADTSESELDVRNHVYEKFKPGMGIIDLPLKMTTSCCLKFVSEQIRGILYLFVPWFFLFGHCKKGVVMRWWIQTIIFSRKFVVANIE